MKDELATYSVYFKKTTLYFTNWSSSKEHQETSWISKICIAFFSTLCNEFQVGKFRKKHNLFLEFHKIIIWYLLLRQFRQKYVRNLWYCVMISFLKLVGNNFFWLTNNVFVYMYWSYSRVIWYRGVENYLKYLTPWFLVRCAGLVVCRLANF